MPRRREVDDFKPNAKMVLEAVSLLKHLKKIDLPVKDLLLTLFLGTDDEDELATSRRYLSIKTGFSDVRKEYMTSLEVVFNFVKGPKKVMAIDSTKGRCRGLVYHDYLILTHNQPLVFRVARQRKPSASAIARNHLIMTKLRTKLRGVLFGFCLKFEVLVEEVTPGFLAESYCEPTSFCLASRVNKKVVEVGKTSTRLVGIAIHKYKWYGTWAKELYLNYTSKDSS
ncbi:hypothetical protein DFH28DRAFT_1132501 [Melampsora americana]|nr:hypothetical protein DFH28DRAFT_1132501 [Melampsora americana]